MVNFSGKTVFITGGSRGIGKAICDEFVRFGAKVIAPSREEMNLSNHQSVTAYLQRNKEISADILVLCAGVNYLAGIESITLENLHTTFQVNLFSSVQIIQSFAPKMKESRNGKIIFISSLYATISREDRISYASSKTAITGLMRTLCLELGQYDILVNAVAPGYVLTDLTKANLTDSEIESITKSIPTGRFQNPKEIADAVLFLSSDLNKSITGQLVSIDGGLLSK